LHARIPPHLTLKLPFETDEAGIKEVERALQEFAAKEQAVPFSLRGFGRFGFRTIYLDVGGSSEAVSLARNCIRGLNEAVPWLPRAPLEGNKLHASVARFLNRRQFARIWRYVRDSRPHFASHFDNVAILEKRGSGWSLRSFISLPERQALERRTALPLHAHGILEGV
jgi:2'-5' RNA ligase